MTRFHDELKFKTDEYAHLVYKLTKQFPKEELYGVISQLRRSALSVALNYIEGYARTKDKINKNFLEIFYGSLKESKYLLHFSLVENYLSKEDYEQAIRLAEDIGAMLGGIIRKLKWVLSYKFQATRFRARIAYGLGLGERAYYQSNNLLALKSEEYNFCFPLRLAEGTK